MAKIAVIGLVGESVFMEVERFHEGGETIHAKGIHREWGGKGFNQAVAAARQGAEVAFLGAASDVDAAAIAAFARQEGIDPVICAKGEPSAYAAILTDGAGETRVTVYPGARLDVGDVASFASAIASADILLLNNEVPEEVNLRAAEIAEANGVWIICNPAPARPMSDELTKRVSLFTPNECEAEMLGVSANVVVTLGGDGCLVKSTGRHISALSVKEVVDTTGAGDVFNGVLAMRLAEGKDLEAACAAANRAAAFSVTRRYVMPSIPHRSDILTD